MEKLNKMTTFQELLKTHNIKKKYFKNRSGQAISLTILTEKKKKDKKKKQRKNEEQDGVVNSEAVQ